MEEGRGEEAVMGELVQLRTGEPYRGKPGSRPLLGAMEDARHHHSALLQDVDDDGGVARDHALTRPRHRALPPHQREHGQAVRRLQDGDDDAVGCLWAAFRQVGVDGAQVVARLLG